MAVQSIEQLRAKKCVPCEGGVPKLTPSETEAQLAKLTGWAITAPMVSGFARNGSSNILWLECGSSTKSPRSRNPKDIIPTCTSSDIGM